MELLLFNAFNGLVQGVFYALMALGLALILSLNSVINMAHGGFLVIGAYLAFTLTPYLGFWGALVVGPLLQAQCSHRSQPCSGAAFALWLPAHVLIIIEGWPVFRCGATHHRAGPLLTQPPKSQRECHQQAFRSRCDWDQAARPVRGRQRDEARTCFSTHSSWLRFRVAGLCR